MTGQNLITVAIPFITVLFLLLVGMGMRWRGMVTLDGARQMSSLVLNISLPALILSTLATEITPRELGQAPVLVIMGVVGPLIGYVVSAALGYLPALIVGRKATFQTAVAITNTGFIGYPLCQALLGSKGLLYAVLYDVGLTAVMSTLSIWILSRGSKRGSGLSGSGWRGLVRSPMMWSLVLGAAWGALDWPTPGWLVRPLGLLGQCATPLALLTVGMLVQPAGRGTARPGVESSGLGWQLTMLAVLRLVVAPALIWVVVLLLRVEAPAAAVIVLQTAMPSAVCTTAMVEQYGGDSAFAAAGVVSTTLLSLLTLPAWSMIVLGSA